VPERGIVGFIDYGPPDSQNFGFDARIFSFYLIPEFQGMGVGGRLFKRCFDELARDGFCSVCLDTLEISPFRGFYEKHGGRIAARDKHLLGGTEFSTIIYGWDIE
jgi:GNAT superfamily N-acetyltransferase